MNRLTVIWRYFIGFMRNYEINEMEREIIGRVEKERLFLAFLSSHYP